MINPPERMKGCYSPMYQKYTKVKVRSLNGDTGFNIVAGVLQGDT